MSKTVKNSFGWASLYFALAVSCCACEEDWFLNLEIKTVTEGQELGSGEECTRIPSSNDSFSTVYYSSDGALRVKVKGEDSKANVKIDYGGSQSSSWREVDSVSFDEDFANGGEDEIIVPIDEGKNYTVRFLGDTEECEFRKIE